MRALEAATVWSVSAISSSNGCKSGRAIWVGVISRFNLAADSAELPGQ